MSRRTTIKTALAALAVMTSVTALAVPAASARPDLSIGSVCRYVLQLPAPTPLTIPCRIYQRYTQIQQIWNQVRRLWTCSGERPVYTFEPQSNRWPSGEVRTDLMSLVGLYYDSGQSSRVSSNFDKAPFNTAAHGRWVYMLYADVRPEDRTVQFGVNADRPWRSDEARSQLFRHGQWVWISNPGSHDCGYYVARTTGMNRATFFSRNPQAKILMIAR